jgi:two-component system, OmpR family, alkaline phosphatase synthesis response regulator PhoP
MNPIKLRKKILIVDDEPDILEFISYNLRRRGYEVITAPDGKEGFDLAIEHRPHLIILDLLMPVMNGFETCIRLRKNPYFSETKILFLSALNESHAKGFESQLHVDGYIPKPIRMELFLKRVEFWMKQTA